jgi:hypothetical protein
MLNDIVRGSTARRTRSRETRNPVEIRLWIEAHGGVPGFGQNGALLVTFDGGWAREEDWVRWFARFEEQDLTFMYHPEEEGRTCRLLRNLADELPRPGLLVVEVAR